MKLESQTLRAILAKLESDLISSGERLVSADRENQASTRALILSPDDAKAQTAASVAQAEQHAARQAHEHITSTALEAKRMLAEALASEDAARIASIRAQVREILPAITDAANEADTAYATYLGAIGRAKALETEARSILERDLQSPAFGGSLTGETIADTIEHLRSIRSGSPSPLRALARERAESAQRRILTALGEG